MSEKESNLSIRRILVALDTSKHSQAALQAAADMAELLGAELMGIFVEDINLLHVAQLSFVNEIRYPMAEVRKFDQPQMEQHWQAQAAQARYGLAAVAHSKQIPHSFEIVRGAVASQLLHAAVETDLLALGRLGNSLPGRSRLGSTAQTAVSQARGSVLLMGGEIDLQQPLVAIYDGTSAARRALVVAVKLARLNGRLRVLIWTDDDEIVVQYRQEIFARLHDSDIEISFGRIYPDAQHLLRTYLENNACGLFVIGRTTSQLPSAILDIILEELDCPILLVR